LDTITTLATAQAPSTTTVHLDSASEDGNAEDEQTYVSQTEPREKWRSPLDVFLEGDLDESIPILDSCDVLRDKILNHLNTSGTKNAAFLRDIASAGWPANSPKIQSKQLNDFLSKVGPTSGSTSRVCYGEFRLLFAPREAYIIAGAYVYFEKKRLFEGKPKSEHRLRMEQQWGDEGLPRQRDWSKVVIVRAGTSVWKNELGQIRTGIL